MGENGGDWIVAGLGNPGARHAGTRHDLGFLLTARLADSLGLSFRSFPDAEIAGPVEVEGGRFMLVRPQLYMNRSGPPLQRILSAVGLGPERMLVACDDVNLPLGRLRLRPSGSAGGHNGLRSIIACVGEGFPRLRMGVGAAPAGTDQSEWVLATFEDSERDAVQDMLERACGLVRDVVARDRVEALTSAEPQPDQPGQDRAETGNEDE